MTESTYLLDRSVNEQTRLTLQARIWEPRARTLIARAGVERGWKCVDLACGPAGILIPLADAVGREGSVVGVEIDQGLAAAAEDLVRRHRATQARVLRADAFRNGLPRGIFDFVHARFMIAPLGRVQDLLAEMCALVRPGGVIALEEPYGEPWPCVPESPDWTRMTRLIRQAYSVAGGDFDAGVKLREWMEAAGVADVRTESEWIDLPYAHPYRCAPRFFANSLRKRIVADGLATPDEIDTLIDACENVAADRTRAIGSFTLVQAWGRKP